MTVNAPSPKTTAPATVVRIPDGFTLPAADLDAIAQSLEGDAAALGGARVFLTGGTGFFGAWIAEGLLYASQSLSLAITLALLTRDPAAYRRRMPHIAGNPRVKLLEGDVRDLPAGIAPCDFVIHAAAESGGAQKAHSRLQMAETIIDGTRNALCAAETSGAKSMLYVSSGAVYGRRAPLDRAEIDEDYPGGPCLTDPDIDYDESKRMAEAFCTIAARERNLAVKIARCFSFIGPYLPLDAHFAAGNFIADALAGREIVVHGDGRAVRSYLYAADLAIWLLRILLRGEPGRPYNVAGSEPTTVRDLAGYAAHCRSPHLSVSVEQAAGSASPSRLIASTRRACDELDLRQTATVQEAVQRTYAWHESRPNPNAS